MTDASKHSDSYVKVVNYGGRPEGTPVIEIDDYALGILDWADANQCAAAINSRIDKAEKEARKDLLKIISRLVYDAPRGTCESFHHRKKDQNHDLGKCPVLIRWEQALDDATRVLEENNNQ